MKKIGIVIIATNGYFILGIRFINRFLHYYNGDSEFNFYFFSNENPTEYVNTDSIKWYHEEHTNWQDGTNSKFKNIVKISEDLKSVDYVYYFDADTNVSKSFNEDWFLGELVGGEHFGNKSWLNNGAGLDRNPNSKAYVPIDSNLPYTYYYGAFFGGNVDKVLDFCKILVSYQIEDKKINYEPPVNDESYINAYFHFNPPSYTVATSDFMFDISDKGGVGNFRNPDLDISNIKSEMFINKNKLYDIKNGKLIYEIQNIRD
jgi:hypothetical protein